MDTDRTVKRVLSALMALKDAHGCLRNDTFVADDAVLYLEHAHRMIALALAEIRKGP